MRIMSTTSKTALALAMLAVPVSASVYAQEQRELPAQPESGTVVTGIPPADLSELPEGPEIKGYISARKDDRLQVTGADGTKTVLSPQEPPRNTR